jgi:hypothetical protein
MHTLTKKFRVHSMRGMTLQAQVTFRVSQELYDLIKEIAEKERRKPNEIARALLDRGAAAYNRDHKLFEPEQKRKTVVIPPLERETQKRRTG